MPTTAAAGINQADVDAEDAAVRALARLASAIDAENERDHAAAIQAALSDGAEGADQEEIDEAVQSARRALGGHPMHAARAPEKLIERALA